MKALLRPVSRSHRVSAIGSLTASLLLTVVAGCGASSVHAASLEAEQHCLALNLYWEARGEGRNGMIAVGWIVLNRMRSAHFPETPCQVVYQGGERPPCEFSWWCDGRSDRPRDRQSWRAALMVAARLLVNPPPDPTGGAIYYHSTAIRAPWSRTRTVRIGRHVFYR